MSKTIADRVSTRAVSHLTREQQAEVQRRLADKKSTDAAHETVREFFSRFGVRSTRRRES